MALPPCLVIGFQAEVKRLLGKKLSPRRLQGFLISGNHSAWDPLFVIQQHLVLSRIEALWKQCERIVGGTKETCSFDFGTTKIRPI